MKGKAPYDNNPNPFQEIAKAISKSSDALWFGAVIEFTQAIAKRMPKCGVNRVQLAQRLDVHPSFITKVLKGDTNISVETIAKLAHALNCDFHINVAPKESLVGEDFALEPENEVIAGGAGKPASLGGGFDRLVTIFRSILMIPRFA